MNAATVVRNGGRMVQEAEMIGTIRGLDRVLRLARRVRSAPTIFHITHHKAGSQWIHRILQTLAFERTVKPEVQNHHFLHRPIGAGRIYPTLYITREQFESVTLPRRRRRFVVIRDLRDTLVSLYFSLKHSHKILTDHMRNRRTVLTELPEEEGLLYLIDCNLTPMAQVQWSWHSAREPVIRYEDLLVRDESILEEVLLGHCRLPVMPDELRKVIRDHRFEAQSGRKPGTEDAHAHERKGVAGDWRNHFTDKVRAEFKRCYGSLLIATGYEKDFNW
jgi:lipopolysaccharide transport system ATP-binding protein